MNAPVLSLDEHRRRAEHRARWSNQRAAAGLLQGERVADCQRSLTRLGVTVEKIEDTGRTEFGGVLTCDSRWHCPLCAAKLTEQSRVELQRGMTLWVRDGGAVFLLTFTFPHDVTLPLEEGVSKMQAAQKKMKGLRAYKKIMAHAGAIGSVKALEVTYGKNGWHPHVHALVFARPESDALLAGVRDLWAEAVAAVGLGRVNDHGFDCRGGDFAADYVAKFGKEPGEESKRAASAHWGASHELTKGHVKQTQRMKGATPFTLLRWYREGDPQSGALFVEYAKAFKGKAQLYWSPGLRKKIDLLELMESKKPAPRRVLVLRLSCDDWHAVIRHDARWELLYVAERYGGAEAAALIDRIRKQRGEWRGDFKLSDPFGKPMPGKYSPTDPWGRQPWEVAA